MKKLFFILLSVILFNSCSKESLNEEFNINNNDVNITYDITGIYKVKYVSNCNIYNKEKFALYNSNYELAYNFHAHEYNIGEFYSDPYYVRWEIRKYVINNDILTMYVKYGAGMSDHEYINEDYIFKFEFKISNYEYHKGYTLTCIKTEYNNILTINEGSIINLEYVCYGWNDPDASKDWDLM